jgi:hypothetical protein
MDYRDASVPQNSTFPEVPLSRRFHMFPADTEERHSAG